MNLFKFCKKCHKKFFKKLTEGIPYWTTKTYCSISCSKRGSKRTLEIRKRISDALKKRDHSYMIGHKWNLGRKWSDERRKKYSGPRSHAWKGGVTKLTSILRETINYKEWRSDVYKRDDFKCVWCGATSDLNADHIIPFSEILHKYNIKSTEDAFLCGMLWERNNGRTLCRDCHKKTATYAVNQQYREYLDSL